MDTDSGLCIGVIIDELTQIGFKLECKLLHLEIDIWQQQIIDNPVDLIFVESAWWGLDKLWHRKVSETASELRDLVTWCKTHAIPTIFWNKEDPVHFERFLVTASLFDAVCTTDIDCIPFYKNALGHDHVYLLPFACQPFIHNPVEQFIRQKSACYAGSYYIRFPERSSNLRIILDAVSTLMPVDIFDRYFESQDLNYRFPKVYQDFIKGSLGVDELHQAYKGYCFGINLNTVKKSPTMFARRVFELLGSGTVVLSNESLGVRRFFGDVVLCADNQEALQVLLMPLVQDDVQRAKHAVAGVRKVMLEHTYAHRLDAVAQLVLGRSTLVPLPLVHIIALANNANELLTVIAYAKRQHYSDWNLWVVVMNEGLIAANIVTNDDDRIQLLSWEGVLDKCLGDVLVYSSAGKANQQCWVAAWLPNDYYGAYYLLDMVLATRYSAARLPT